MALKLPEGAEAGFRIESVDAFGCRFAINIYGYGHSGWFVASHRSFDQDRDSGVQQLPKGEWPTLLHLINLCGFWSLPEDGSHLADPTVDVEDGEWLTIVGRDQERYHRIHRFIWREWGVEAVLSFGRRVSGFFVRDPRTRWWVLSAEPEAATPPPQAPEV
jgi:hypothetical protein